MKITTYVQVVTTTGAQEGAQRIARSLVEAKLAGCVQVLGPISSTYWWEGRVESVEEWPCIVKSKASLYEKLERAIRAIHPYDVAEILAVPVLMGHQAYLEWLDDSTQ